jgi:glycosyltransferase involved in cell wall biosynthesis
MPKEANRTIRRVVIVQRRMTHYRVAFFERLRAALANDGIVLDLLVGEGTAREAQRRDGASLSWAKHLPTRYFAADRLCWQPFFRHLRGASLVIVTQENTLLANHLLLLGRHPYLLAFWGHGANLQSTRPDGWRERFKRWTTRRVDWWFAYTALSARLIAAAGFPASRTTILNNAVDTSAMQAARHAVRPADVAALRQTLGLGPGPVGVYLGSLDPSKRLDFLFASAARIRDVRPDFSLLLIGDGPERDSVRAWCRDHPWAVWVGSQVGDDKARHLAIGDLMLNPGAVGLGVFDAFVHGLPLVTTGCGLHGPEIEYLEQGRNGLICADVVDDYARCVVELLDDPARLQDLRLGCTSSARRFSLDGMVENFRLGIGQALALKGPHPHEPR